MSAAITERMQAAAPLLLKELQHVVRWHDQLKPADLQRMRSAINSAAPFSPTTGYRSLQKFGGAPVLVEYETEEGEDGGTDHPSYDASVTVLAVLLNGEWVSADEFKEETLDAWSEAILAECIEAAKDQRDNFMADQAEYAAAERSYA